MAGRPHRTTSEQARDAAVIARMHLEHHSDDEIAAAVGLSPRTVAREVVAIRRRWRESSLRDFEEARAMELARLDGVEQDARIGYARSCLERTRRRQKTKAERSRKAQGGAEEKVQDVEQELTREDQVGDPRFLRIIQDCISQRCRILGLEAPRATRLTTSAQATDEDQPVFVDARLALREATDRVKARLAVVHGEQSTGQSAAICLPSVLDGGTDAERTDP